MFPERSPDEVPIHPPGKDVRSEGEPHVWKDLTLSTGKQDSEHRQVLTALAKAIAVLELAPTNQSALEKAVNACCALNPQAGLQLASSLPKMRGLSSRALQDVCLSLEILFTERIAQLDRTVNDPVQLATSLLSSSVGADAFQRTAEFLSYNTAALGGSRFTVVFDMATRALFASSVEVGEELRQMARLEIVERAITEHWRNSYLDEILDTFRSPSPTKEGHRCRLELLQTRIGKNSGLLWELRAVTTLETLSDEHHIAAERRFVLFDSRKTRLLVECLDACSPHEVEQQFLELITDCRSRPISEEMLRELNVRIVHSRDLDVANHIKQLQQAVVDGCSLDLACAAIAVNDSYLPSLNDIVRPISENEASFAANRRLLYQGIDAFYLRQLPYAGTGSLTAILDLLTSGFSLGRVGTTPISARTLIDPSTTRKFLLCLTGVGLRNEDAISSLQGLGKLIVQLTAHEDINMILDSSAWDIPSLQEDFASQYYTDNPPFSLARTPVHLQQKFTAEVWSVFQRAQDAHYGFWANTYEFRHTPVGRRCPYDEMTYGWNADRYLIPCSNPDAYPGRGRMIKGLDLTTIFDDLISDATWREGVLKPYGPLPNVLTPGNVHALDNLTRARIIHTRVFDAFAVPENTFFSFLGVPLTLVTWNHHFDATGADKLSLVPTAALGLLLSNYLVSLDSDLTSSNLDYLDISDEPPTRAALTRAVKRLDLKVGIIDVTNPSNFTGGFCNGLPEMSAPLYSWESPKQIKDWFGRSHKWHIRENTERLTELWGAHDRIYEITSAYLNLRDVFKLACGLDARGYVKRYRTHSYDGTPWQENQHIIRHGREKLKLFCEFSSEYLEVGRASQAPVLVLAPMKYMAPEPTSPIVLDGISGYGFHEWGKPFDLNIQNGEPSIELLEWWSKHVDPWLSSDSNFWYAPRLVARENYIEQMEEYGYRR